LNDNAIPICLFFENKILCESHNVCESFIAATSFRGHLFLGLKQPQEVANK